MQIFCPAAFMTVLINCIGEKEVSAMRPRRKTFYITSNKDLLSTLVGSSLCDGQFVSFTEKYAALYSSLWQPYTNYLSILY